MHRLLQFSRDYLRCWSCTGGGPPPPSPRGHGGPWRVRRMARATLVLLAAFFTPACSGTPTEPTERRMARRARPEGQAGAARGTTRYDPGDEARELRSGVELLMRLEQGAGRFSGTVTNRTEPDRPGRRVEIHLSNGLEFGRPRESIRGPAKPVRSSSTLAARSSTGGPSTSSRGQVGASRDGSIREAATAAAHLEETGRRGRATGGRRRRLGGYERGTE